MQLTSKEIESAVAQALAEDLGSGDVTSLACIPPEAQSMARMRAREPLTLAGINFALTAFHQVSPNLRLSHIGTDRQRYQRNDTVLEIHGTSRAILIAERVALNFVQRLSGIATLTAEFQSRLSGLPTRLLDTRKTTPGWRRFEKYAVHCGGGCNHRMGLWDRVLIKDNHLAALAGVAPHPIVAAVKRARRLYPDLEVEVETDTLDQVKWAVESGADRILLDNMSLEGLRTAGQIIGNRSQSEASGGVRLETIRSIAETGVDFISVGALTHSVRSVDLGLDFVS